MYQTYLDFEDNSIQKKVVEKIKNKEVEIKEECENDKIIIHKDNLTFDFDNVA